MFPRLISYSLFEGRPLTTKGRWINPIVFLNINLLSRIKLNDSLKSPIFIVGSGRSGTTLLGSLLSFHRQVSFLNEPKAIWYYLNNDDDLIGSYGAYPGKYRLTSADADPRLKGKAQRIYANYLLASAGQRVVDKYPELIFRLPYVKEIFPDAKFIFIFRNGYDTIQSITNWSIRNGAIVNNETHDWWGKNRQKWHSLVNELIPSSNALASKEHIISNFCEQVDMASVEWILVMEEGLNLIHQYRDSVFPVSYEKLIKSPTSTLYNLLSFCRLDYDAKFYDYAQKAVRPQKLYPPINPHHSIREEFSYFMKEYKYK